MQVVALLCPVEQTSRPQLQASRRAAHALSGRGSRAGCARTRSTSGGRAWAGCRRQQEVVARVPPEPLGGLVEDRHRNPDDGGGRVVLDGCLDDLAVQRTAVQLCKGIAGPWPMGRQRSAAGATRTHRSLGRLRYSVRARYRADAPGCLGDSSADGNPTSSSLTRVASGDSSQIRDASGHAQTSQERLEIGSSGAPRPDERVPKPIVERDGWGRSGQFGGPSVSRRGDRLLG
jgi:hypothetical protein